MVGTKNESYRIICVKLETTNYCQRKSIVLQNLSPTNTPQHYKIYRQRILVGSFFMQKNAKKGETNNANAYSIPW